ncbi:MAG: spherulation-specific family 4 protein [Burkholderiaceae bacterium]|nr:spherulation-specific family 4 protein [Burkholderiaceae bacterium]
MRQRTHANSRVAAGLLFLTAALAGCGGTTEPAPAPAPPPPPAGPISVRFSGPVTDGSVHDTNSPINLQISVAVEGKSAPDGTLVTLSASRPTARLTRPVTATVAGTAASEMQDTQPGAVQVEATATSKTHSDSDRLALFIRPKPKDLELLVPAFFSAAKGSPWDTLTSGAASYPNVKITAVAKSGDGILTGTSKVDADLLKAITAFKAVQPGNQKVVGYVATALGSGTLSVADIKTTVDQYLALYPGLLDGIYFGEMASASDRLPFYTDLYTYVHGKGLLVIGNPGSFPDAGYASVADVLVTFEGNASAYQSHDPQPAHTWVYGQDNTRQAALVHSANTCTAMQSTVATASKARVNTGRMYVTDLDGTGSRWSALPAYWTKLLGTVDAYNNNRSWPAC